MSDRELFVAQNAALVSQERYDEAYRKHLAQRKKPEADTEPVLPYSF